MKRESLDAFYRLAVLDPDEKAVRKLELNRTDWEEIADIACRLFSPLILYKNIKRHSLEDKFKPGTLARLKSFYFNTTLRNMRFVSDFFKLARLFNNEGIRLVPLKGISMLIDTYLDDGLRPLVDLDVLIDMNDFKKALDVLKDTGYKMDVRSKTRGLIDTNHGQDYLVRSPNSLSIELHYRLFAWYEERYVYKIDNRSFFNDSFVKTVNEVRLGFLKKEDEFYYLLMNTFNNRRLLRYYLDCDSLVRAHGRLFDWERVAGHIHSSGIKKHLIKALDFIAQRLKTPLPDRFLRQASAGRAIFIVERPIFRPRTNRYGQQINNILGTQNIFDKMNLVIIYIKWLCFKRLGLFRDFFRIHNNPARSRII